MSKFYFFQSSENIANNITEVFDFIWPTAVAMWNLRWQVSGLTSNVDNISELLLHNRFASGSDIRGANLKRACNEKSWQEQKDQFSKFLLIELCALYESWIESMSEETNQSVAIFRGLQFIENGNGGHRTSLSRLQSSISNELNNTIYPVLKIDKKYSYQNIDNLIICYRYFKECRNVLIHGGGIAKHNTLSASNSYSSLTALSLGVEEVPKFNPILNIGDRVSLDLRGIVGFSDVIIRIISTFDTELSRCHFAEDILKERWNMRIASKPTLPASDIAKKQRIEKLFRKLHLPTPENAMDLLPLLKRKSLVN